MNNQYCQLYRISKEMFDMEEMQIEVQSVKGIVFCALNKENYLLGLIEKENPHYRYWAERWGLQHYIATTHFMESFCENKTKLELESTSVEYEIDDDDERNEETSEAEFVQFQYEGIRAALYGNGFLRVSTHIKEPLKPNTNMLQQILEIIAKNHQRFTL